MSRCTLAVFAVFAAFAATGAACGDDTAGGGEGTEGATGSDSDAGVSQGDADETAGAAACTGDVAITCAPPVTLECQGPLTNVDLDDPVPMCEAWTLSTNAPEGYGVGQTPVTFDVEGAGMTDTCVTEVTVTDAVAPEVTCPAMEVLVRTAPDAEVLAPPATATDLCAASLEATAKPAQLSPGTTTVQYSATDSAGNVGACSVDMGVIDVFAARDFQMLDGTLLGSGETQVTFGWEPFESEFVAGYRLESAPEPNGPWSEVAVMDASEQLHTLVLGDDAAQYRLITVSSAGDGGATPPQAAYRITDAQYDIRNVPVPTVPFDTTLYGVVRHPTALGEGPFPLVVMLHGNHGNCRDTPDSQFDYCSESQDHECALGGFTTPNAQGHTYLAETLAAQGIVSVSISGNAMNCREGYIGERAQLIAEHLRYWRDWNTGSGELAGLFEGTLDLSRVGLFGHSRGGDAVSNTPGVLAATPIAGVEVRSIFATAPTDYLSVDVRDTNLAVLLPSCDGDVFSLVGMEHYDRSTDFDDGVHQSQVFFIGANHNFFNTTWTISDWEFQAPDIACQPDDAFLMQVQQHSLSATLGPWFRRTLDDLAPVAYQRAYTRVPSSYGLYAGAELDWRWSYSADERVVLDDFAGNGAPSTNAVGGSNAFTDWLVAQHCFGSSCDNAFTHVQWVMRLLYDDTNVVPVAQLGLEGLDASSAASLSFRTVSRLSSLNTGLDTQEFTIRVTDVGGEEAQLLLSDLKEVRHLYGQNVSREILETVQIPIEVLAEANPALDLSALSLVELEMTTLDTGSVIVTDFEMVP